MNERWTFAYPRVGLWSSRSPPTFAGQHLCYPHDDGSLLLISGSGKWCVPVRRSSWRSPTKRAEANNA